MSDFFHLLLASLAVFRASELVAQDNGPWHVFRRLRECSANPYWCELLSCFYCLSAWFAAWVTVVLWAAGIVPTALSVVWWLAIAGGAVAIMRLVRKRE